MLLTYRSDTARPYAYRRRHCSLVSYMQTAAVASSWVPSSYLVVPVVMLLSGKMW